MEKKSIGKLISALRRTHGMTQKELGEKLFVSDKTVSRWECDECTPELSLIPVIAELFGITTDELLRGECNPRTADAADMPTDEERRAQAKAQNDKLVRRILHQKQTRYKNLSLISVGIALVGLITAAICDLSFYRGILGCCLASVFYLAGIICQCCFVTNARYNHYDEDDHAYDETIVRANSNLTRRAITVIGFIVALFAFTLPIAVFSDGGFTGVIFLSWLLLGIVFAGITVIIEHILYMALIRNMLIKKALLVADEQEDACFRRQRKLLIRVSGIASAIAVVFAVALWCVSQFGYDWIEYPVVFDNYEDFVAFMDDGAERYKLDMIYTQVAPDGSSVDTYYCPTETVYDANGNVLCEYKQHPSHVSSVRFSFDTSEDGLPVKVITRAASIGAKNTIRQIQNLLICGLVLEVAVCAIVYVLKCARYKKQK